APLSQVAHVHLKGVVPYVTHQNLVPYATIWLSPVPGEGLSVAARRADQVIAKAGLPPGVTSQIGGYYREQQKSFRQMLIILGAALLILLVLLGYQFGSQKAAIVAIVSSRSRRPGLFWRCWRAAPISTARRSSACCWYSPSP
ncbi:transporter, AcrB/AcrD/AcrF family, partial [mine drainage metagenome]